MPEVSADRLKIGGLARLSSVDWPGELVATVFVQGCPWRCPYCHNGHLLAEEPARGEALLRWPDVHGFLAGRVGLLDGVVFSGGEPLAQEALIDAAEQVAGLGFKVGLHTNGVAPERLGRLLPALSWVGFDLKAPLGDYERITGVAGSGCSARESLRLLAESAVPFEVRSTIDPDVLGVGEVRCMAEELHHEGVRRWVIQPVQRQGEGAASSSCRAQVEALIEAADTSGFESVEIRG